MCGIAGIVGDKIDESKLIRMLESQQHRGPDYTGIYNVDGVSFGHNRLSIIDLSSHANQPFQFQDLIVVFNGEIYNYIELKKELSSNYDFRTSSDTEVLAAAFDKWGKDCLKRLNGMFAFAIWNKRSKELFAARDRFGVKPFYYYISNEHFYFASEIKALQELGIEKKPNKKVWASYLAYGTYGMPNETFWEDIIQLPGGYSLTYKNNKIEVSQWYDFISTVKKHQSQKLSFDDVKQQYKDLVFDSIKLRFRADVNVGFNISGGLDSSALLALVNETTEKNDKISAYTFYTGDERYDELPWVKKMLKHTNNPLEEVLLKPNEDLKKYLVYISKIQDEPYGGIPTIAYSNIFKKARENGTIVLLDGQGMDEQWAGYDYYIKESDSTIQGVSKSPFRPNVLTDEISKYAEKPVYPKPFDCDVLNKQYRDIFYSKIPRALRFNDRVSMAYSTELREPFLDYRLVEFAFSQPIEYKVFKGRQKYLLRELVSEYLSDSISYAPKRPLQTPQREWLGNELKEFVNDTIASLKESKVSLWFNFDNLEKEWEMYLNGDNDSSFHIWQWINTSLIFNENNI